MTNWTDITSKDTRWSKEVVNNYWLLGPQSSDNEFYPNENILLGAGVNLGGYQSTLDDSLEVTSKSTNWETA